MIDCTHKQLIDVWMELEQALEGQNSYDGTIAEIHLYTVQAANPALDSLTREPGISSPLLEEYEERRENAVRTIYEICKLFAEKQAVTILIEDTCGQDYVEMTWDMSGRRNDDSWILDLGHRMHIKVQ